MNYDIYKKIYDAIPENGDPIRYNKLYDKLKPNLKRIKQIEEKKSHRKLGMMSKSTLTKYLDFLIFENYVIRTKLEGTRGGGVEYRRNLAYNKINEMANDATNTAYYQYIHLNHAITKIIKLLLMDLKKYSETDKKNQGSKDYRLMIDDQLAPMLNKLTKHVEEEQLDEDVFRCLLGDHNNSLRYKNYEYGYYKDVLRPLLYNTDAEDEEPLIHQKLLLKTKYKDVSHDSLTDIDAEDGEPPVHQNLVLKTKYKDVEDKLLSSINKEKVNEK